MYITVVILPLIGSLISGFGGRLLGYYGASIFATSCVGLSFFLSLLIFYEVGFCNSVCYISLSSWISTGTLTVNWGFLFDAVTSVMLIVVTSISTLVHMYSISYMENDPHCPRFMSYLEIFTFFMLVLVTADNTLQMFLGWEGVGLASYLLINFWFTRLAANQSAIKALVVNRIGDFGLSIGIFALFYIFNSVDYLTIFSLTPFFQNYCLSFLGIDINTLTFIGVLLFIGAVGKSAQLGLHTWLPDAMEGPTPVSALIHAATMVTAGVFLIIRFSPLVEYSSTILGILIIFGSLTTFFAAMTGTFQNDLKRVIAYSTCSQLGYMVFACGLSCYNVSMFHLTNHAFFKALLFLSAGSIIHALSDEQDMRRMGSLSQFLPVTYSLMLIGSLALTGFPFLAGFYSKDFILELSQIGTNSNLNNSIAALSCWLGTLSVLFTSFYSFRLIYLAFLNNSNSSKKVLTSVHESNLLMLIPLLILAVGSIFIGYLTKDFFIGFGTNFWNSSIFILPYNANFIESEFLEVQIKWLPFLLSTFGIILATIINLSRFYILINWNFHNFFAFLINKKWFWDFIYSRFFIYPILTFGYNITLKNLDRGFIELAGPYGVMNFIPTWANLIKKLQTGQITHYIFFMILGLCSFFILFYLIENLQFSMFLYFVLMFFI
uniref:NADH-ubiquinone oxidoreductase chain 5 n=1 Tax=Pterocladiella musciformis TaxID=2699131 RepID=A0A1D8X7W0_9FLOR|nr:NADH dehydrogenase subunit 5 [Pterocladiella musciformis]AOX49093.1 NADH dehydrogenase subunit 5 [Pterocladiella musciformis]